MELRLLTTNHELRTFSDRLAEARACHGTGFEDTPTTLAYNRDRLIRADVYGLFRSADDSASQMIAGVTLHDLDTFPQSCTRPNLTHLPRRSVLECGDHWSLSLGAGVHAWRGIALQVVHRAPKAVLIYLAVRGADHSGFYAAMGFVSAGDPIEYTHLQRSDSAPLLVQPMILDGAALARLTESVDALKFEALNDFQIVRFDKSDRLRPAIYPDAVPLQPAHLRRHDQPQPDVQSMEA